MAADNAVHSQPNRRLIVPDAHQFVGRVYDLSVVSLHFDTWEEIAEHPDVEYALRVNDALTNMVQRVESLNQVGDMIWLGEIPSNLAEFPVDVHVWLTASWDAFLIRYISVVDCALILANQVFEAGVPTRSCNLKILKKKNLPESVLSELGLMLDSQTSLRAERNARTHHGVERTFTSDDTSFRFAAMMAKSGRSVGGEDCTGEKPDAVRYFREALSRLQIEQNEALSSLEGRLERLFSALEPEFEERFVPRFRAGKFARSETGKA